MSHCSSVRPASSRSLEPVGLGRIAARVPPSLASCRLPLRPSPSPSPGLRTLAPASGHLAQLGLAAGQLVGQVAGHRQLLGDVAGELALELAGQLVQHRGARLGGLGRLLRAAAGQVDRRLLGRLGRLGHPGLGQVRGELRASSAPPPARGPCRRSSPGGRRPRGGHPSSARRSAARPIRPTGPWPWPARLLLAIVGLGRSSFFSGSPGCGSPVSPTRPWPRPGDPVAPS